MRIQMGDTDVRFWLINTDGACDDALEEAVRRHVDPQGREQVQVTVLTGPPCGVAVDAVHDMTVCRIQDGQVHNPIMDALASIDIGF